MSKDAYWFKHDSNARNDPKMAKLLMLGGQAAIGSFWCLIEIMREADNYRIPLDEVEGIKFLNRFPADAIDHMIKCKLISVGKKYIWSESLNNRMGAWDEVREKRVIAGKKGGRPKKQTKSNCLASEKQMLSKPKAIRGEERREEKKRREEKNKRSSIGTQAELLVAEQPVLKKIKKPKESKLGSRIWDAYSKAYELQYHIDPIRNAKTNSICMQLGKRLGEDAVGVAAFFLTSRNDWYVKKGHSLNCLLDEAEKIRTEWKTGNRMTSTFARTLDKEQTIDDRINRLIERTDLEGEE